MRRLGEAVLVDLGACFLEDAMRGKIAFDDTGRTADERHAVIVEDLRDLVLGLFEGEVDLEFEHDVGVLHAPGERELERDGAVHEVCRLHRERRAALLHPARERSPNGGDVELAVDDALNLAPGLSLGAEVGVSDDDVDIEALLDAAGCERLADAGMLEDADPERLELRIVQILDLEALVVAIGEDVGGAVDRRGHQQARIVGRHVDEHLAFIVVEGIAGQSALEIGAPEERDVGAHLAPDGGRDLVLEAFELIVGQRHVAGIGTCDEVWHHQRLGGFLGGGQFRRGELVIGFGFQVAEIAAGCRSCER